MSLYAQITIQPGVRCGEVEPLASLHNEQGGGVLLDLLLGPKHFDVMLLRAHLNTLLAILKVADQFLVEVVVVLASKVTTIARVKLPNAVAPVSNII